jgi:hypothetical protein
MSQRITFYTTLVQREKLDEWSVRETEKHIGSFVLAIPIVPLVKEAGQIGPKSNRPQVKIIEELKLSSKYSCVLYQ